MTDLATWSVRAINLPEHADNIVHTDAGAIAAGYPAALVAGTSVFAYLSHIPAAAWGTDWLGGGGAEVRFRAPVFNDDLVELVPVAAAEAAAGAVVEARVDGDARASCVVWRCVADAPPVADVEAPVVSESLPDMVVTVDDAIGGYGTRAGDDLTLYRELGVAHPALWPVLGNRVTMASLVTGPWIHVRSRIQHRSIVPLGAHLLVQSNIVRRFDTRAGKRVVLDVRVSNDGEPVARIEHESIIELAGS